MLQTLSRHPQLEPNRVYMKGSLRETYFFNELWNSTWTKAEAQHAYAGLFPMLPRSGLKASFEKTPTYIFPPFGSKDVDVMPSRIHLVVPNAKLLLILRNPVTWLHSLFYPLKDRLPDGSWSQPHSIPQYSVEELRQADVKYMRLLETEGYQLCDILPEAVRGFLKRFSRDALLVEVSEHFAVNSEAVMRRVEGHLGLTAYDWSETELTHNRWNAMQRPPLAVGIQEQVWQRCWAPMTELQELLNLDLLSQWSA